MKIWVGESLLLSNKNMFMLCVYFFLLRLGDIRAQYFYANGLWWKGKWVSIIESVLNLLLNIILGYVWGIDGIIIATLITIFFVNHLGNSKILFECYFGSKRLKEYFRTNLLYICLAFFCSLICYNITNAISSVDSLYLLILRFHIYEMSR